MKSWLKWVLGILGYLIVTSFISILVINLFFQPLIGTEYMFKGLGLFILFSSIWIILGVLIYFLFIKSKK
jgi:hypothetical protein